MEATRRRTSTALARLIDSPEQFDFYQAMRLLEMFFSGKQPVGYDEAPSNELVTLKINPSLAFFGQDIKKLKIKPKEKAILWVNFMGMVGNQGALPDYYTEIINQRQPEKDTTLIDFLDLFHHRTLSLFYRAWEKNHSYCHYEKAKRFLSYEDKFSNILYCLIGHGTKGLLNRLPFNDEALLYYSGLLMHKPRNALGLEAMLSHYFDIKVKVKQYQGQWTGLAEQDRSRLGNSMQHYSQLGINSVAGHKIWYIQSKFRLQIGPLTYKQFRRFLPDGDALPSLHAMVRYYVGQDLTFDVQLLLHAEEVPSLQLQKGKPLHLGWDTWFRRPHYLGTADDTRIREQLLIKYKENCIDAEFENIN